MILHTENRERLFRELAGAEQVGFAALQVYGYEAQRLVALEELAELSAVLARSSRPGRVTDDEIRSEIADVLLVTLQLANRFGLVEVAEVLHGKTRRLALQMPR